MTYSVRVDALIAALEDQVQLGIDPNIVVESRVPSNATSEFLTNKQQGDWAEKLIASAINSQSKKYFAVPYGRQDDLSAGDEGFVDFYQEYQRELNEIGKRPDLLIFSKEDFPSQRIDISDSAMVSKAKAALEVRSSAFLEKRYREVMGERTGRALRRCKELQELILKEPLGSALKNKSAVVHKFIAEATDDSFRSLSPTCRSWSTTEELRKVSELIAQLKSEMKVLRTRDFLSITPKVEDIALVGRWIRKFGVPHFYVQVFFDGAFAIPFERILEIPRKTDLEEVLFRIEKDTKNQNKTTVKISVDLASQMVEDIEIPSHSSKMKELARGRLLFFVTFDGESGRLNNDAFEGLIA